MSGVNLSLAPKAALEVEYKIGPRGEHLYGAGGKWYPSVTKILDQWDNGKSAALAIWSRREALKLARTELMKFSEPTTEGQPSLLNFDEGDLDVALKAADRRPDDIKTQAGDLGSEVHSAVDKYILSGGKDPDDIPERAKRGYANFRNWHEKSGITIISPDVPVVNPIDGYGGRLDSMGKGRAGEIVCLDWKTSNKIRDSYAAQLGGYMGAVAQTFGWTISAGVVVRFNKETEEVEAKWVDPFGSKKLWNNILSLYKTAKTQHLWLDFEPAV